MDKYETLKQIGRGSFGRCMLVQRKVDKKMFVLKEVNVQEMTPNERKEAMNEVTVLSVLRHPNIIAYHESFVADGLLNIVMEYAEGGDLHQVIQKKQGEKLDKNDKPKSYFSELEVMTWFCQIALALQYTHKKNILHRDLKTQNIFLTGNKAIKLGDFGIAKVLNSDTEFAKTIIGTPYYLSPEMCEDQPYDNKSDVWALGCVLYELSTLRHAFDANSLPALVLKILKGDYPPIPQMYSKDLANLVKSMLRTEPRERPSITDILNTSIVQKYLPTVKLNNFVLPRKPSTPSVKRPTTVGGEISQKSPNSPEKLQFLKLKNEPKAKSKENLRKAVNSNGPPGRSSPLPAKAKPPARKAPSRVSDTSSTGSTSAPSTPRGRTPPVVASPRARTPPPVGSPRISAPRGQKNSPRPYSSPANAETDIHIPTPRPGPALFRGPDPVWIQKHQQAMQQRAKSEPMKRMVGVGSLGVRKASIPTLPSQTAKTTSFTINKKRVPLKDELKQHEQKFKDNLKSVKSRIAKTSKPFGGSKSQDEDAGSDDAPQSQDPVLSPRGKQSTPPGKKELQLLILVPPQTPAARQPQGSVSAPTTPRQGASPAPPFNPVKKLDLTSPRKSGAGIASPRKTDIASPRTLASVKPASAKAPAAVPATRARAMSDVHALGPRVTAATIKANASSKAILQKQKSFTAKTETLKEVIKKNRLQIKKQKEDGGDLAVQIVLPKYMEHLLIEDDADPQTKAADADPHAKAAEADPQAKADENGHAATPHGTGEGEEEGDEKVNGVDEGDDEREDDVHNEEEGKAHIGDGSVTPKGTNEVANVDVEAKRGRPVSTRLSVDLSDKMDRLSLRIETLRQKCEQVFGEDLFFRVYKYSRDIQQDADDKETQQTLLNMVGPEKLAYLRYVDQLIYCELQFYGT